MGDSQITMSDGDANAGQQAPMRAADLYKCQFGLYERQSGRYE